MSVRTLLYTSCKDRYNIPNFRHSFKASAHLLMPHFLLTLFTLSSLLSIVIPSNTISPFPIFFITPLLSRRYATQLIVSLASLLGMSFLSCVPLLLMPLSKYALYRMSFISVSSSSLYGPLLRERSPLKPHPFSAFFLLYIPSSLDSFFPTSYLSYILSSSHAFFLTSPLLSIFPLLHISSLIHLILSTSSLFDILSSLFSNFSAFFFLYILSFSTSPVLHFLYSLHLYYFMFSVFYTPSSLSSISSSVLNNFSS